MKEIVINSHKEVISRTMPDSEKHPDQLAYDKLLDEIEQVKTELTSSKKADVKKI